MPTVDARNAKVKELPSGDLEYRRTRRHRFVVEQILGAIIFAEGDRVEHMHHSVCVAARMTDGRVVILGGWTGMWEDLSQEAINLKDRLLCTRWICSDDKPEMLKELKKTDGFRMYHQYQGRMSNRWFYTNPPETWPHFRDYDHTAMISKMPEYLQGNQLQSSLIEYESHHNAGRIIRVKALHWKEYKAVENSPFSKGKLSASPLRAAMTATLPLLKVSQVGRKQIEPDEWYGNMRRT